MKKPKSKEVRKYMRKLAKKLGVSTKVWPWVVTWSARNSDGRIAEIILNKPHSAARVNLFAPFSLESPADQRDTLVHELLHCETEKVIALAKNLKDCHPDHIPKSLEDDLNTAHETLVCTLARMIAPHMPPVPWAKKKGK